MSPFEICGSKTGSQEKGTKINKREVSWQKDWKLLSIRAICKVQRICQKTSILQRRSRQALCEEPKKAHESVNQELLSLGLVIAG